MFYQDESQLGIYNNLQTQNLQRSQTWIQSFKQLGDNLPNTGVGTLSKPSYWNQSVEPFQQWKFNSQPLNRFAGHLHWTGFIWDGFTEISNFYHCQEGALERFKDYAREKKRDY